MIDWKESLHEFLWDKTSVYEEEEIKLITDYVENLLAEKNKMLEQAVKLIEQWHNMNATLSRTPKAVIEEIWHLYYSHAPEMKVIREALEKEVIETR